MTVFSSDRVGAVIVAGGRASRFGSDKLAVEVEGLPLLRHAVDAALMSSAEVVVVGNPSVELPAGVTVIPDAVTLAGPYAAVAQGLDALDLSREVVLVLAGDLLDPAPLVPRLLAALLADDEGRRQPLLAAYRVGPLVAGIAGVDTFGRAAYALLDGLHVVEVHDDGTHTRDVDTPADLP